MTEVPVDAGNTAWVLICAALVFLMTPGLAFFYGGMVRSRSVLNMMMMSFGAIALVGVIWVLWGYSIAFGTSSGGFFGNPFEYFGLNGLLSAVDEDGLPVMAFIAFQGMFAIITVALISGAVAGRMKYGAWLVFAGIWATLVYFPVAHWVWGEGGWILDRIDPIDFAGGTVVHINAGVAALALILVLGRRIGFGKVPFRPHNLPFVMLGAALLWFGWFGFNAGSALGANETAAFAFVMTVVATAAASLAWMLVEKLRDGAPTSLGAASGIVAGLVAITPAAASVDIFGALAIGVVAGVLAALAVGLKYKLKYDDSLDVIGVHLVGGLVGTLMIGLVATELAPTERAGLFYGGGIGLLVDQALAAAAVIVYCFIITLIVAFLLAKTMGIRISKDNELEGIDLTSHAETAYDFTDATYAGRTSSAGSGGPGAVSSRGTAEPSTASKKEARSS